MSRMYILNMEITNWSNREMVKFLTSRAGTTQKKLAQKVYEDLGQDYNPNSFASKMQRNSMRVEELQAICKILGYEMVLHKKDS